MRNPSLGLAGTADPMDDLMVRECPSVLVAKAVTTSVPIVFAGRAEPVALGLVASSANPTTLSA
jgi:ABC-type uncharacterized transport system substrate-binding protein